MAEKGKGKAASSSLRIADALPWGHSAPRPPAGFHLLGWAEILASTLSMDTQQKYKAQWPIGYGVGLRIKRSSVRIRPWALRWVLGQGSLLPLFKGEAFTLASISYLAILVKYILAKKKHRSVRRCQPNHKNSAIAHRPKHWKHWKPLPNWFRIIWGESRWRLHFERVANFIIESKAE